MSTPYHFTPRIPSAPHPTPHSASSYKPTKEHYLRPPIHNPYDKFTQPEFDAWIGGITGALKRALGQEDEEDSKSKEHQTTKSQHIIHSLSERRNHVDLDDDSELSEGVNDSFAEIKARRVVGKGKARDPREGPGLSKGNSLQPIEILSSDDEDAEDAAEVELSMVVSDDNDSDRDVSHDEEEYYWERGQSSSPLLQSPDRRSKEVAEYGSEEEDDEEEGAHYDEEEEEGHVDFAQEESDEIIEIDSDSEGEISEPALAEKPQTSPSREMLRRSLEHDDKPHEETDAVSGDSDEYSGEDGDEEQSHTYRLLYSRQIRHSQGFESQDEDADVLDVDADEDDEIREIQPPQNDTSFPPKHRKFLDEKGVVELPDPWSGPRVYAEDFYSGGDVRIPAGTNADVHRLGPLDVESENFLGQEASQGINADPQNEENTSFPPLSDKNERPVDLIDPWEGPRTYAEDFYTGGPVSSSQGTHTSASYIGPMDIDSVEILHASVPIKATDEQDQLLSDGTAFPEETSRDEIPIEIQDPWVGPQTFAEDYYSGGDIRTTPDVPIDPSLLTGTGEPEDDIDGFLTPGALTSNQAADDRTEDVYDEHNDEYIGQDEDEGVILPPSTDLFVSSTQLPIPVNGEHWKKDQERNHRASSLAKEGYVESEHHDLDYLPGYHIHHQQEQEENNHQSEEAQEEAEDFDRNALVAPVRLATQEQTSEPLTMGPSFDHSQQDNVQNLTIEHVLPPEEDNLFDFAAEQFVDNDTRSDSPIVVSNSEAVNAIHHQHSIATKHMIQTEVRVDSVLDNDFAEDGKRSQANTLRDTPVVDAIQMGSESLREHSIVKEIVQHSMVTESTSTILEDTMDIENDGLPTEGSMRILTEHAPVLETHDSAISIEVPLATVGDTENDDADIRSTPGIEDLDSSLTSAVVTASDPSRAHSQPLGLSPDNVFGETTPSGMQDTISLGETLQGHEQEPEGLLGQHVKSIEEDNIPGLSSCRESETPQVVNNTGRGYVLESNTPYSVNDGNVMEEDAEGEPDEESGFDNIEIKSVGSGEEVAGEEPFSVEEMTTEGRLTVEPSGRGMSLDVVSVTSHDAADIRNAEDDPPSVGHISAMPLPVGVEKTTELFVNREAMSLVDGEHQTVDSDIAVETLADSDAQLRQSDNVMPIIADSKVPGPSLHKIENRPSETSPVATHVTLLDDPPLVSDAIASSIPSVSTEHSEDAPSTTSLPLSFQDSSLEASSPTDLNSIPSLTLLSGEEPNPGIFAVNMDQNHESLRTRRVDGLASPAEPAVTLTEYDINSRRILDEMAQYVFGSLSSQTQVSSTAGDSSSVSQLPLSPEASQSLQLETRHPVDGGNKAAEYYVSSQVPTDVANTSATQSLPSRAPAASMKMTLTRKPTDPILMADPYPYCLSTPGPAAYSDHHEALEEDTGLEGSQSLIPSIVEPTGHDHGASNSVVNSEDFALQYPPNSSTFSRQESLQEISKVERTHSVKHVHEQDETTSQRTLPSPSPLSNAPLAAESSASKRKRGHSPDPSQKISTPPKPQKQKGRKGTKAERKGKGQAVKADIAEPTSEETIHVKPRQLGKTAEPSNQIIHVASIQESQVGSGANAAHRLLQPGSRSSSVSSVVPYNRTMSHLSPTLHKPSLYLPSLPPTINLGSLFHAHGQKRKALSLATYSPFSPLSQSKQLQLSRFPSTSTIPDLPSPTSSTSALSPLLPPRSTPSTIKADTDPTSSTSALSPLLPPRSTSSTIKADTDVAKTDAPISKMESTKATTTPSRSNFTTPVTRSHCRYHRISLPKEEGGTRINFLVPGCSLNDRELMEEEEIVDHGDATVDDSRNMLKDIENLGFSLDLIGIIRQLVGLDILREQEVFYLPQPGEVVTWTKAPLQKSASEKAAMVRAPGEASSQTGSPGGYSALGITGTLATRHPLSHSSYSSTPSVDSAYIRGSAPSFKPEHSDDDEPAIKRSRRSPEGTSEAGPSNLQSKSKSMKSRRSKKRDLNYEPGEEDPDDESDHELHTSRKRRKSTRGVKRNRTNEILPPGDKDEERESKKFKSDSANPPPPQLEPQSEPQTTPIRRVSADSAT